MLASWMGGEDVAEGAAILREAGIPTFAYPDTACILFNHLWQYADRLKSLYETPRLPGAPERGESREEVDRIIAAVADEGRTLLTEYESKKVLAAYGIPITDTELAQTADEAVTARRRHGLPGRRQAPVADDHAQDGRRRRRAQPAQPRCRPRGVREDPRRRDREGRRRALRGRDGPADDQLDRLRADRGLLAGSAVRTRPAVRHGRPAGRGVQGPGTRAAAAQHDAREASHRGDGDLAGAQGRPRAEADRQGCPRRPPGAVQRARGGAAADRRDRHQPAARVARADHRARRTRGAPSTDDPRCGAPAARDPTVPPRAGAPGRDRQRRAADGPPDPSRGRAGRRALPRRPVRGDRQGTVRQGLARSRSGPRTSG